MLTLTNVDKENTLLNQSVRLV